MSAEIKPGQTWKDRHSDDFLHVDRVGTELVTYTWDSGRTYTRTWDDFLSGFEPTTPAPPLPTQASDDDGCETAPLDPGAVKAGDEVTVSVLDRDIQPEPYTVSGRVYSPGHGFLAVGMTTLRHNGEWDDRATLTAHTPAPEPEPEWEPGTVAVATVRGVPRVRILRMDKPDRHPQWLSITHRDALGATLHHARQVTDVRPLVVLDPAALQLDALADVIHDVLAGPKYQSSHAAMAVAEAIEVHLSGHGYSPSRDGAR